jgi:hypothetical protein
LILSGRHFLEHSSPSAVDVFRFWTRHHNSIIFLSGKLHNQSAARMNFYFDAAKVLDRLGTKQGSIKGILAQEVGGDGTDDQNNRKRMAAAVIRTLECTVECSSSPKSSHSPLLSSIISM